MSSTSRRDAGKRVARLAVFALSLLIGTFWTAGIGGAAKPSNSLKSKGKEYSEARVKLYERTLRKHLASDPYPLIDLEVSLDEWKSAAGLIEGMDRAGVALGAVTSASEEAVKKAVAQYPGRLVPLTTSAAQKDWKQAGGGYLAGIKRQLDGGAFGVGKVTWRPASTGKSQMKRAGEALGAVIRLAVERRSFFLLDMPPDDDGLDQLERLLRETPEAKLVWTQAGRILNLNALPGYGHGLLRALSLRHAGLLFTLTQDPPAPRRCNHCPDKPPLRPGRGVLARMAGVARSARGALHRRERCLPRHSGELCGEGTLLPSERPREYQPRRRKAHRLPERMAAPHEPALEALIHEIPPNPLHPAGRTGIMPTFGIETIPNMISR